MKIVWETFHNLGRRAKVGDKVIGNVWKGSEGTFWYMHKGTGLHVHGPVPSKDEANRLMIKGFEAWIEKQDAATKKAYGIKETPANVVH